MDVNQGKPLKVIVFGEAGVGKSALSIRCVCQKFSTTYEPTIEDNYEVALEVDECPIKLEVVDTAGNDVFRRMREQYITDGDGFLLVYSITDRWSYHSLVALHELIIKVKKEKDQLISRVPVVVVANKCDLEEEREVTYQDGTKLAAQFSCPFFETSAKKDIAVAESFIELARQVKESKADAARMKFVRRPHRFSARSFSFRERKCKESLQALRAKEKKPVPRRRTFVLARPFICGARRLFGAETAE